MITKINPDKNKALSLKTMAKITLERLEKTDKESYPSNTLSDYYDVIHKLMEAITLRAGVKFRGEGAHQELIDYVAKKYGFAEHIREFLQQMRDYRNRISYEGFVIHKNFIVLNKDRIEEIIKKLFDKLR